MTKPCTGCPDAANQQQVARAPFDITRFRLPQVYHQQYPTDGHPLQALQYTLPAADGLQRPFQRPVFGADGSIEYPKLAGDTQPPDEIEGYQRDPANPWRFLPAWDDCLLRMQGTRMIPNGCIQVAMACNSPDSPHFGRPVLHADCSACPVRVPRKQKNPASANDGRSGVMKN